MTEYIASECLLELLAHDCEDSKMTREVLKESDLMIRAAQTEG